MTEETPKPPRKRRRWRRVIGWAALAAVVLPLLLVAAALVSLRAQGVRQAVLARVSRLLAEEYGLALSVGDFTPSWRSSRIELRDVRLGAPGSAPLVTAERVGVSVDLRTLRRRPLVLRALEVEGWRADLAAPIPEIPETPEEPNSAPPLEIRKLALRRGSVVGAPMTGPAAQWLRSWSVDGIDATGSLKGKRLDLALEKSRAVLDRPGFGRQEIRLTGKAALHDNEVLEVEQILGEGDGLKFSLNGFVSPEKGALGYIGAKMEAEPRALMAGVPRRGEIYLTTAVVLPSDYAGFGMDAKDVPAETFRQWIDPKLWSDLSLAGTTADLQVTLKRNFRGPKGLDLHVKGEGAWRRGERRFVSLDFSGGWDGTERPMGVGIEAQILPGSPGRKVVTAEIGAPWGKPDQARIDSLRAEVRLPDVRAAFAEARSLWPRLVPAPPEGTPLQGSLAADLRLSGDLKAPQGKVDATWLPQPGSRVHLQAEGRPLARTGTARVRTESLPLEMLGAFAPGLAGTVTGDVDLSGSPKGYRTRVQATTAALAYPPALERLDSGTVAAEGMLVLQPLSYRGTVDVQGSGLFAQPTASGTAQLASFALEADGLLQGSPLRWDGQLTLDGGPAELEGQGRLERFEVTADGSLALEPLAWDGNLLLDGAGVEVPGTATVDLLTLSLEGRATADLRSLDATATVDAGRLVLTESGTEVRDLRAELAGQGNELRISSLSGALPEGRTFAASGRIVTDPLLAEADLDLRLVRPIDAVPAADLTARLRQGVLEVNAPDVQTASGPASLRARVPLGALRSIPQLTEALASLPFEPAQGQVTLSLQAPELDSQALIAALGMEPRPERIRAGVVADLTLDPAAPAAGQGEIRLTGLTAETDDGRLAAGGPVVLRLGDGRLDLQPVHLRVEGEGIPATGIDLQASAGLARSWNPLEDPLTAAVTRVSASGNGALDASLLNPYLEGGAGEGSLAFSGSLSGTPGRLSADVRAGGENLSFLWPGAGLRIDDPRAVASLRDGRWTIQEGKAGVNGGDVDLSGGLSPEGAVDVRARLAGVRYRLDYGLETLLSGDLRFQMPPGEGARSRLSGRVVVDRGVLDRNISLDREVLTVLFAPDDTPGTEESALAGIDLDLDIETTQGVRIQNNIGKLRASWQRLDVTGTPESPIIRGRIDLDPGGLFWAYGQTVRIDRGSLLFRGDPLTDPEVDLAYTTSIQDPRIANLEGASPLDLLQQAGRERELGEDERNEVLAAGLQGYYGARVLERLGSSLGFTVQRPALLLEADPSARLTIARELSRTVALAFSIDLRNAERQTYLLYVQELRGLPGLRVEALTNDQGNEGATLQQAFELGGSPPPREAGPLLDRVRISTPKGGVSKRRLRRAIRLEKREPVPEGAAFGAELDIAEYLRRRGYPGPRVNVEVEPSASRPGRVDLAVTVEPGPRVSFQFEGDRPPRALRPEIATLYRTDFYEQTSIEEMRQETVRAFRAEGHVRPRVEIEVQKERPEDPDGPRRVTIRGEAGRKSDLEELRIAGVAPEDSQLLAARFPGVLSRAELAAGQPGADRRLLDGLRTLGYPEARIATRFVRGDGGLLVVTVEPGPRQTLTAVEIAGVEEEQRQRLLEKLPLRAGDPARLDLVSRGALEMELDLEGQGFSDAAVRSELAPEPGRPGEMRVVYQVEPGTQYRLADVGFEDARWSNSNTLGRVAGLDTGGPFTEGEIEEARARLFQTGVFSRVEPVVEKDPDGNARVSFSLTERPRFLFGYGARWESSEGTSGVVNFVDQNFLGRAMTFGFRGLYQPDDRSGRLYLQTGGLLGTGLSLESYAEVRREIFEDDNFIEDREEAALQLALPVGRHDTARAYLRYRTTRLYEIEPDPFFPLDLEIRLPYIGLQFLRDTRDDRIDTRTGLFTSLDLSGSGNFLGSDFEYIRLFGQASAFRDLSLAGRPMTWASSARVGLARPFAGQEMIRDERFFAGGPYSVRGYEMESLGPQESLGTFDRALGGEALFILNQELRFPLPLDLTGIAFFDAGQVWADPGDADFDLAKSLGLGLRARTPLGLIRFDAAFPLDRRPQDDGYKLYLGFGNAF